MSVQSVSNGSTLLKKDQSLQTCVSSFILSLKFTTVRLTRVHEGVQSPASSCLSLSALNRCASG